MIREYFNLNKYLNKFDFLAYKQICERSAFTFNIYPIPPINLRKISILILVWGKIYLCRADSGAQIRESIFIRTDFKLFMSEYQFCLSSATRELEINFRIFLDNSTIEFSLGINLLW